MTGIRITWAGADGSMWDLTNGPVRLDKRAIEGFGDPEWTRSTRVFAGVHGQRRSGTSLAKARSGFLPFFYIEPSGPARVVTARSWWGSWDPDEPGTLTVTQPDGTARFIRACFEDDNGWAPTYDPYTRSTEREGIDWIADDPWWRGPTVTKTFGQSDAPNFFPASGYGPPFFISSSNILSTAALTNPGDIESAPRYTLTGPVTSFDLSVDGHQLSGSLPILSGQRLILDADVTELSATLIASDGSATDVTPQLDSADFARISKGASVPLSAHLIGLGSLQVALDPLYRRAW